MCDDCARSHTPSLLTHAQGRWVPFHISYSGRVPRPVLLTCAVPTMRVTGMEAGREGGRGASAVQTVWVDTIHLYTQHTHAPLKVGRYQPAVHLVFLSSSEPFKEIASHHFGWVASV